MNSGQVNGHYQSSHHQHHHGQYATSSGYQVNISLTFSLSETLNDSRCLRLQPNVGDSRKLFAELQPTCRFRTKNTESHMYLN